MREKDDHIPYLEEENETQRTPHKTQLLLQQYFRKKGHGEKKFKRRARTSFFQ